MDPTQQSTGLSTGDPNAANPASQQQQNPAFVPPVNPAQTVPQQQQDFSGIVASYEQRISRLMSEKDKAINERDKAITELANLQRSYTDEKQQTHQSLNNTAQAAQTAIDQARAYENQIKDLQGQLLRSNTLLEKPHLAPYSQFIPTSGDAEQMKALVEQLETIRNQDLERARASAPFPQLQQQQSPNQSPSFQSTPLPQNNPFWNLYANRPNMAPNIPASSPAMMNPAGAGNPTDAIQQLLNDAMRSGDQGKYQSALEQAKTLANAAVQQQLGR